LFAPVLCDPTATPTKSPSIAVSEETKLKVRATYHFMPVERRMAKSPGWRGKEGDYQYRNSGTLVISYIRQYI